MSVPVQARAYRERIAYAEGFRDGAAVRVAWAADELRMMPAVFVDAYGALWEASLRHPQGSLGGPGGDIRVVPRVNTARTSSGQSLTRRGAHPEGKSGGSERDIVVSERMLREKGRVDRKLRKLAREVEGVLRGETKKTSGGRCWGCGRMTEGEWRYCPWDGVKVQ
jgi:hypothetical protein